MRGWLWIVVLIVLVISAPQARADEADVAKIQADWKACTDVIAKHPDQWIGWKRSFFNGYADNFYFWFNSGVQPPVPSVLRRTYFIDAIAILTTTYCYRNDETLAFILTVMESPNAGKAKSSDKLVVREGRIYVGPDGKVLQVLGRVLDDKKRSHPLDNRDWQPMRGCGPVPFLRTVSEAEKVYVAELGDIEGKRPNYVVEDLNWCAKATPP